MTKDKTVCATAIILTVLTGYNAYKLHSLEETLGARIIRVGDKVDSVAINTNGKLQNLESQYGKLANIKTTGVTQKEIVYVQKQSKDDADIELSTGKPRITVAVNGGKKYSFDLLQSENNKFEQGKLVLTSTSAMALDVTTDEYKKSKWQLTTAMNADKQVLGGLSYSLGHNVSAGVYIGQGIKPYYGLNWNIGSHSRN